MLINFDTFWTFFLHAPCSSPTLTRLSPSSITTVQQQQQPPLLPPSHTSQIVRSGDASHFTRQLRGEEANERSRTQGGTASSTWKQSNWNHKYSPKSSIVSLRVKKHLKLKRISNTQRERNYRNKWLQVREKEKGYEQVMPVFLFIFGYFLIFII